MIKAEHLIAAPQAVDVIGHLFWFSIGQQMNRVDELEKKIVDSGVGKEWLPNPIRPADAFRRATREVQSRKPTDNPKVFKNILVREVFSDIKRIQRNIVVETVDQKNKSLGYDTQSAVMELDKESGNLSFTADDTEIRELCKLAEKKYYLYRDHYSSQHIRVMITKILNSLAPTPMREKGIIYFVPNSMTNGLTSLVNFINSLDNSSAYKVSVINSKDNRHMVNKELSNHLDRLLKQCRSTTGLRKDQIKNLVEETNNAIKDFKEYKELTLAETERFEEKIILLRSEVINLMQS